MNAPEPKRPPAAAGRDVVPLVVDVDGTLVKTDLLHETAMQFIARHPMQIWRLLPWLAGGKSRLKGALTDAVDPHIETIPLRDETVELIRQAQAEGRPVYLASASDRRLIEALATRLGGIAGVFGTEDSANLAGAEKAKRLNAAFGPSGYDYVGDQPVDFAVWSSSRHAIAVSHSDSFARRLRREHPDAQIIASPRTRPRAFLKAMRPHQWAKNALIFLSMVAGHNFAPATVGKSLLAFVCFCLAASSAYLLNDLLDLPGDREHPRKRKRPFAAGDAPISAGLVLSAALMATSLGLSLLMPARFIMTLAGYVVITLGYSLVLKRRLLIDVITLGGLYTIRVLGGIEATGSAYSPWLLMFCLFLFLSLAIVKRCSELVARREMGETRTVGRGYRTDDLQVMQPLGAAAGYGAVLVVALYLSSTEVVSLYHHPTRMWLVAPLLLYWISRVLILSGRGELHDDPVVFALRDRVSWITGACVAAVVLASV